MSETHVLEDAIKQNVENTLTNYLVIAVSTDGGEEGDIELISPDGQPGYITLGLIESAKIIITSHAYGAEEA